MTFINFIHVRLCILNPAGGHLLLFITAMWVGLDAEWASHTGANDRPPVAVVQIASGSVCLIVLLKNMAAQQGFPGQFPHQLCALLANERCAS